MQKLVYDNYNKFITATETIKEMKNDVFSMDDDMEVCQVEITALSSESRLCMYTYLISLSMNKCIHVLT